MERFNAENQFSLKWMTMSERGRYALPLGTNKRESLIQINLPRPHEPVSIIGPKRIKWDNISNYRVFLRISGEVSKYIDYYSL